MMTSPVPLPAYAMAVAAKKNAGTSASRRLALNSAIMEAQREWEEGKRKRAGGKDKAAGDGDGDGDGSDSHSGGTESDSTTSDAPIESAEQPSRVETKVYPPLPPTIGAKRGAEAASLSTSLQAAKRRSSAASTAEAAAASHRRPALAGRDFSPAMLKRFPASKPPLEYNESDAITHRKDGTAYDTYVSPLGHIRQVGGVIIPTNYRPGNVAPLFFHCPDKSCIKSFESWQALAGHFSSGHKGLTYNDNCDGTLTMEGIYRKASNQVGRAIVVSQVDKSNTSSESESGSASSSSSTSSPLLADDSMSDAFLHVSSLLSRHIDYDKFTSKPYIQALCRLPQRRSLPQAWSSFHFNKEIDEEIFALALAYVTGLEGVRCTAVEDSTGVVGSVAAAAAVTGNRLGEKTVFFSPNLAPGLLKRHFDADSCIGCLYHAAFFGVDNRCSYRKGGEQFGRGGAQGSEQQEAALHSAAKDTREKSLPLLEEHRRLTRGMIAARTTNRDDDARQRALSTSSKLAATTTSIRPLTSSQIPSDKLEMENWEIAPGNIMDSLQGENVAYSNAYLNGRQPVDVTKDLAFNVLTIKPGDKTRLEAQASEIRVCSVASGKIDVKLVGGKNDDGNKSTDGSIRFSIGPNGMVVVRPGETCVVTNKLYVDATLHCFAVQNYSVQSG